MALYYGDDKPVLLVIIFLKKEMFFVKTKGQEPQ